MSGASHLGLLWLTVTLRLWYFITAILAGIAIWIQAYCFSRTGWDLTAKLRSMLFGAVLRHDIEWFDEEKHSVSYIQVLGFALTGLLRLELSPRTSQISQNVSKVFGDRLSVH